MAEVLSQSQIDALLNSVISGGEVEQNKTILQETPKKERKYDFRAPKKFTKENLKILDSVYNNYARLISSHLTSVLRLSCEVDLIDIEEQNFGEFSNALNENDVLTVMDIDVSNAFLENEPVMLQVSNPAVYSMMDRMLGGNGELSDNELMEFTDIELALYSDIVNHMIPLMNEVWKNFFDISFKFSNVEVNPRLMHTLSMDDVVVIVVLNIKINDNVNGKINICLPGSAFEIILKSFESTKVSGRRKESTAEKAGDNILYNISGSTLELKVDLGESQVMLSDVFNLREGDIINLNKSKQSDAIVYVEGKPWFTAKLGAEKQNIAVQINGYTTNL